MPRWHHVFVDAVLRQALEPILRDLKRGGLDEPRIEDRDWTGDSETTSAMLWGLDGGGSGISVLRSASPAERVADLADQVQEWAIEDQLWRAGATNWPRCPAHPNTHPLEAAALNDDAVWVCPVNREVVAHIGEVLRSRSRAPMRHVRMSELVGEGASQAVRIVGGAKYRDMRG